jgi:putative FmdB family regulatory protein
MPLYECECARCDLTFEVLASISESGARSFACPECGRRAPRIPSAIVFKRGKVAADSTADPPPANPSRPDVTRLKVPPPAQLCWMDGPSRARYAAYLNGRGAEYDDTMATRADLREQRGEPAKPPGGPDRRHRHSDSPLADPAVYARRRAAAVKKKSAAPK